VGASRRFAARAREQIKRHDVVSPLTSQAANSAKIGESFVTGESRKNLGAADVGI
jgi:hypothetical protein